MSVNRWDIPRTWAWSNLGTIAEIVGGGTPPTSVDAHFAEDGIPWITPADLTGRREATITRGKRGLSQRGYDASGAQMLPAGAVLFSSRAPIGYCVIAAAPLCTSQGFKSLVLFPGLSPEYVRHYLLSAGDYARSLASGTTFLELSATRLAELAIPIPPQGEQKRIVERVTDLMGRTERARLELLRIPSLIIRYRQQLLDLAATGELTRTWREAAGVADWTGVTINELATAIFDGPFGSNLKSSDYTDGGVRVVRLENIGNLSFIREKESYISEEKYAGLMRHTLLPGDVLFSSFIAETIRVCLFPDNLPTPAINKADCFCIRVDTNRCLPAFLAYRLASRGTFDVLKQEVHGSTRPRISLKHLRGHLIDLPSLEEQAEIVRLLDSALGWLGRLEADHEAASRLLPKLDAAVLAKAFRGDLSPQNPTEPSAQTLLQDISLFRAQQLPKPRRRKRPIETTGQDMAINKNLEQVLTEADDWLSAQDAFRLCGVGDGTTTREVERLYAELRELDRSGRIDADSVEDDFGRKLHDRLRLKAV